LFEQQGGNVDEPGRQNHRCGGVSPDAYHHVRPKPGDDPHRSSSRPQGGRHSTECSPDPAAAHLSCRDRGKLETGPRGHLGLEPARGPYEENLRIVVLAKRFRDGNAGEDVPTRTTTCYDCTHGSDRP
jgi:hypothetical protein